MIVHYKDENLTERLNIPNFKSPHLLFIIWFF